MTTRTTAGAGWRSPAVAPGVRINRERMVATRQASYAHPLVTVPTADEHHAPHSSTVGGPTFTVPSTCSRGLSPRANPPHAVTLAAMEHVEGGAPVEAPLSATKHDQVDAPVKNPVKAAAEGEATTKAAAAVRGSITETSACLVVDDMPGSLSFYVDVLGYKIVFGVDSARKMTETDASAWPSIVFASLSGTGESGTASELMLETRNTENPVGRAAGAGPLGKSVALYLQGPDPDAVAAALPPHVEVLAQPHTQWYGMREVTIADPVNGYTITIGRATGEPCPSEGQGATDAKTK